MFLSVFILRLLCLLIGCVLYHVRFCLVVSTAQTKSTLSEMNNLFLAVWLPRGFDNFSRTISVTEKVFCFYIFHINTFFIFCKIFKITKVEVSLLFQDTKTAFLGVQKQNHYGFFSAFPLPSLKSML